MNKVQQEAVESLERALRKCRESDLAIYGMDNTLLVVTRKDATIGGSIASIDEATKLRGQHIFVEVNAHGAYIDSGGW